MQPPRRLRVAGRDVFVTAEEAIANLIAAHLDAAEQRYAGDANAHITKDKDFDAAENRINMQVGFTERQFGCGQINRHAAEDRCRAVAVEVAVGVRQRRRMKQAERRAAACADAVRSSIETMRGNVSKGTGATATRYLSTAHRDDPSDGCPLSAIGSELGRCDGKTRAASTDGFLQFVDVVAGQFGKTTPDVARRRALVAVSTMIGAMTMSRIVTDPDLSEEILRSAEESIIRR